MVRLREARACRRCLSCRHSTRMGTELCQKKEIEQAVAALKKLDKDNDGKLSQEEIGWPPRGRGGAGGFGGGPGAPGGFGAEGRGWSRIRRWTRRHLAALAAAAQADVVEQVDSVVEVKEEPVAEVQLVVKAEAEQATWSSG